MNKLHQIFKISSGLLLIALFNWGCVTGKKNSDNQGETLMSQVSKSTDEISILTFNVENLFDTHYRVFASGISSAGRNIVVSFRAKF